MLINAISSNIRFETPSDGLHDWPNRKKLWASIININKPDILGTQEGRRPQIEDASSLLQNNSLISSHRDWIEERMYPSLFINKGSLTLLESGDFWLSETPHIPGSSSFDSSFPRLCTWAQVASLHSKVAFFIFNCHLDHVHPKTRVQQALVLTEEINKINKKNDPFILMGDFNDSPISEVREAITTNLKNLKDPWIEQKLDEEGTHHKFNGNNKNTERIDWILHSCEFDSIEAKIIKDCDLNNNLYPSDHFPIQSVFKSL